MLNWFKAAKAKMPNGTFYLSYIYINEATVFRRSLWIKVDCFTKKEKCSLCFCIAGDVFWVWTRVPSCCCCVSWSSSWGTQPVQHTLPYSTTFSLLSNFWPVSLFWLTGCCRAVCTSFIHKLTCMFGCVYLINSNCFFFLPVETFKSLIYVLA